MSRAGSVKQDRSGKWRFVLDLSPPGAPKRKQVLRRGFETKAQAQSALDAMKRTLATGSYVEPTKETFGAYLLRWLDTRSAAGLKPTTIDSYRRSVTALVIPSTVAGVPLQSLTALDLDGLYARLLREGGRHGQPLSARSVRYVHTIIRKALGDALRQNLVAQNPALNATPPRAKATKAPKPTVWSPAELARFLDATKEHKHGLLFRLAAMTGMRRGELCGLRWGDIDFDARTITVLHTITTARHQRVVGTPKSDRSIRVIDVDPDTIEMLRALRREQGSDLVFSENGEPLHPDVITRSFERRVKALDLPRIRLHDLRHTHASHLLAAGVNVKVVSERLGHASVAFTLDTYAHLMPGQQASAAAAVAALVSASAS